MVRLERQESRAMPNDSLRRAMKNSGVTAEAMAHAIGVDPKTVQRWVSDGTTPYARHQAQVAAFLGEERSSLWPEGEADASGRSAHDEILDVWAHRADVPKQEWWDLLSGAANRIDLLGYALHFLPEDHLSLCDMLADRARGSCAVRIALADPDSAEVADRDAEEALDGTFSGRIRSTLRHLRPITGCDGIEVRLHRTRLYASVFRADDRMFVTPHLYALHGHRAPLLSLGRVLNNGIFDNYVGHFERVWSSAVPLGES